jgi:hypothetical protein
MSLCDAHLRCQDCRIANYSGSGPVDGCGPVNAGQNVSDLVNLIWLSAGPGAVGIHEGDVASCPFVVEPSASVHGDTRVEMSLSVPALSVSQTHHGQGEVGMESGGDAVTSVVTSKQVAVSRLRAWVAVTCALNLIAPTCMGTSTRASKRFSRCASPISPLDGACKPSRIAKATRQRAASSSSHVHRAVVPTFPTSNINTITATQSGLVSTREYRSLENVPHR